MKDSWQYQKRRLKEKLPNREWVIRLAQEIDNPMVQCYVALAYLTAGRISELRDLKKEDIEFAHKKGKDIILVNMKNSKNKHQKHKKIGIPMLSEPQLIRLIKSYINGFSHDLNLFPVSSVWLWKLLFFYDVNPHYLRHIRLSHLVIYNDFNEHELVRFAGWTDARPARAYIHLKYTDMLKKL